MSKCYCPNSFCKCLYGCACRIENSGTKNVKRCLCCQVSTSSKQKKTNNTLNNNGCQSISDFGRVDDIIIKLEDKKFESVRYGCKVEIYDPLEFKPEVINSFETFNGKLEYVLKENQNLKVQ